MRSITAIIAALALVLVLASAAFAQSSTTLGRWVQSQPPAVRQTIGCDLPTPYSTYCWQHVAGPGGRIVATIYYRQHVGYISMWRVAR